jgi:hypothetical protein
LELAGTKLTTNLKGIYQNTFSHATGSTTFFVVVAIVVADVTASETLLQQVHEFVFVPDGPEHQNTTIGLLVMNGNGRSLSQPIIELVLDTFDFAVGDLVSYR